MIDKLKEALTLMVDSQPCCVNFINHETGEFAVIVLKGKNIIKKVTNLIERNRDCILECEPERN